MSTSVESTHCICIKHFLVWHVHTSLNVSWRDQCDMHHFRLICFPVQLLSAYAAINDYAKYWGSFTFVDKQNKLVVFSSVGGCEHFVKQNR